MKLKIVFILFVFSFFKIAGQSKTSDTLFDFTKEVKPEIIQIDNAKSNFSDEGLKLNIAADTKSSVSLKGSWDLSDWIYLTITIKNNGSKEVRFEPIISGKIIGKKWAKPLWNIGWIKPGETRLFNCLLLPDYSTRKEQYKEMNEDFPNMRGMPEGISFARSFDLKQTEQIQIKFPASSGEKNLILVSIITNKHAKSKLYLERKEDYFPFIDEFGQYKYANWDGKIISKTQLKSAIEVEKKDLAEHKGSLEWNEFGGFKNGPKLKATDHFRTEKIDDKWWIVDPIGNLFWSAGVNSAGKLNVLTPYVGREYFFEALPDKSDPIYGKFYKKGEYNFGLATLYKKYGTNNSKKYAELSLKRMHSWGLNTFAGWSYENVKQFPTEKRVPYTAYIGTLNPKLNEKFPDVFNPNWEMNVRNSIKRKADKLNSDPYFFGYFVDNEMHWYQPNDMASKVLSIKGFSYGKQAYIKLLKNKFSDVKDLNSVLETSFLSWNEVKKNVKIINLKNIEAINIEFYKKLCHIYFKTIKNAIDEFSPGNLYLGCRWHIDGKHRNKYNVPIGAEYLDIISFNQYDNELTDFQYPLRENIDKPYLISEFNFGALDSGKFYPGLGYASDQRNRGEKYKNFIESALRDPKCVGAHWFMWGNSTTAGRSVVGENANCGLVSEMDTPYYELLKYIRETTYNLYNYRIKEDKTLDQY